MQIPEYMSLSLQGYQFIRFGYLTRVNLTHSFFTFKSLICQLSELKCNAQLKKHQQNTPKTFRNTDRLFKEVLQISDQFSQISAASVEA